MRATVFPKTLPSFLWHMLSAYRTTFAGMLFSMLLIALLTALNPWLMKLIIDVVSSYQGAPTEAGPFIKQILWPVVFFIVTYQLTDLVWAMYDYFKLRTLPKIRADVINQAFAYLQGHSYGFFQKNFSGNLSNRISDLAKSTDAILAQSVDPLLSQIFLTVILSLAMGMVSPWFTLMLAVWALVFLGTLLLFSKKILRCASVFSEANSVAMGKIVDSVSNIINAKLFARSRFERQHLNHFVKDSLKKDQQLQSLMLTLRMIQGFSIFVLFAVVTLFLIWQFLHGLVTAGDFTYIWTSSIYIMQGLWYLSSHFLTYSQELGICKQALATISAPQDVVDLPQAAELIVKKGRIEFDRVTFYYSKGHNIFRDKSLVIKGGQKVGLVGLSGSGKTTFTSLILRFFDIHGGRILIDGQNIAEVTQDSLRSQIAMIPQEPILFHRSLMENIRYGDLQASDEAVIEASHIAHCHEFIAHLEHGYDTPVGERGLKLSGGQRQRIAIARAILKKAPILILDEATSALDSITEQKIKESVHYLMQNRTTLVIAHRLSTLSDMDRILVFDKGCVVEDGSHEELIAQEGHYATLWNMQVGGFLLDSPEEEEEFF
jgi:ATP-binding cassette subfamily B protein